MKAFEETPRCDKCGSVEVKLIWQREDDCILCICQTCFYRWKMFCKDHVETDCDDEADIQKQLDNTGALK